MGQWTERLSRIVQQGSAHQLLKEIQKGAKKNRLCLKKLAKLENAHPSEILKKALQGAQALTSLPHIKASENELIECAFLAEFVAKSKFAYWKNSPYDIQQDSSLKTCYIHFRDRVIGKGMLKKVTQIVRYDRLHPEVLVAAETIEAEDKEEVDNEIAALQKTAGMTGVIQCNAILRRVTKKGALRTSIIQKQYVPGALSRATKLPIAQKISIVASLLKGLQNLHAKNLVHRDLKLKNLLYDAASNEAVLADLGQVREVHLARDLPLSASRLYNPPEALASNRSKRDPKKADIFAIGCAIYRLHFEKRPSWMRDEILSTAVLGKKNYADRDRKKLFVKEIRDLREQLKASFLHKKETPTRRLKQAIFKMLHPNPDKRPDSNVLLELLR